MPVGRASILQTLAVLLAVTPISAGHAEVRIEGTRDLVRIDIDDAPLQETFDALSRTFGFRVHGAYDPDQRISGTYRGSLRQVVRQFLTRYNYAAVHSGDSFEIRIFGPVSGDITLPSSNPLMPTLPRTVPVSAATQPVDKARRLFIPR
jgi:hypothetical protein